MALDASGILNGMKTAAQSLGVFDQVLLHEPKSAPQLGNAVTLALWSGPIRTIQSSGLNSVSLRWEIHGRVFHSAFTEPADDIEVAVASAAVAYYTSLLGGFSLGGLIRCVDVYGSDGEELSCDDGYIEQDSKVFRCYELRIPLLINDVIDLAA